MGPSRADATRTEPDIRVYLTAGAGATERGENGARGAGLRWGQTARPGQGPPSREEGLDPERGSGTL